MPRLTVSDYPSVRFAGSAVVFNELGFNLIPSGTYSPAVAIVEGIDVIDDSFTETDQCRVSILVGGVGGTKSTLFQAFTYAQSQGYFAYRGAYPLAASSSLLFDAIKGQWSVQVWGHIEPAFGLQP